MIAEFEVWASASTLRARRRALVLPMRRLQNRFAVTRFSRMMLLIITHLDNESGMGYELILKLA